MGPRRLVLLLFGAVVLLGVGGFALLALVGSALDGGASPTSRVSGDVAPGVPTHRFAVGSDLGVQLLATPAEGRPQLDPIEVVRLVSPAVVTVVNDQTAGVGKGQVRRTGTGTGFIIAADGYVVTNWHVVDGGNTYSVVLANGQRRRATLIGADEFSDLAVVRIEGQVPASVRLGDSNALQPGQRVLAIGSPLGTFTNTVTRGVVSAVHRDLDATTVTTGAPRAKSLYTDVVQHDAAINPGNSGGPLINLGGEVVGVNTLGISQTADGTAVQGLFFAIPINTVRKIATQLIDSGRVAYPYVGVTFTTVTDAIRAERGLPVDHGALVTDVPPGSPGAAAGILPGDVIVAVDGTPIAANTSFTEVLFAHRPGERVTATIRRGDRSLDLTVTLGVRPAGT